MVALSHCSTECCSPFSHSCCRWHYSKAILEVWYRFLWMGLYLNDMLRDNSIVYQHDLVLFIHGMAIWVHCIWNDSLCVKTFHSFANRCNLVNLIEVSCTFMHIYSHLFVGYKLFSKYNSQKEFCCLFFISKNHLIHMCVSIVRFM